MHAQYHHDAVDRLVSGLLMRSVSSLLLPRFQSDLDSVPRPLDRARQHAPGPDQVRVLVLGNGLANGFGVRSQGLALPGRLAEALGEVTGRGVEVDLDARRGLRIAALPARIDELPLGDYDAVVLTVGPTDAGSALPIATWRDDLHRLLRAIATRAAPGAAVVLVGCSPLLRSPRGEDWFYRRIDAHARRMDAASEAVLAEAENARYLPVRPVLDRAGLTDYAAPAAYRAIADALAGLLAPMLPPRRAVQHAGGPAPVGEDAAAVSRLIDAPVGDRLLRLIRSARDLFGVRGAALTLVDGDRVVVRVAVGFDEPHRLDRRGTLVDAAVGEREATVLGHVRGPVAQRLPSFGDRPTRFYAAMPLEAPSGGHVGALCVFDTEPRDPSAFDTDALRTLAAAVQTEMWTVLAAVGS